MIVPRVAALCLLVLPGEHTSARTGAHTRGPAPQAAAVAGTYRVAVCEPRACMAVDSTRAFAWGTLVLFDAPIADSVRARVRSHFLTGPANGCFVLRRSRSQRSLAGLD